MNNDPISQLPEPYRVAWEIMHESFDYETMLRNVLASAVKMVSASWGMMLLDTDVEGLRYRLPGFRTLPDILNTTIPIGYISSLAYSLARQVFQDGQSILIADMSKANELELNQLIDDYLPMPTKEKIMHHAKEQWYASRLLEIPASSNFTIMVLPISLNENIIGAVYLHRSLSQEVFTNESLEKIRTFLTSVSIGVQNARRIMDVKHLALQFPFTLSSELRTPLLMINGYAKLIHDYSTGSLDTTKIEFDAAKFSKIIIDAVDRMKSLLDSLLVYARIEQDWITKQGVKLHDILNPIIEKYRVLTQEKEQVFILNIDKMQDIEISADNFLSEVIDALIKNAHLYTPRGGKIQISASMKEDTFHFNISDTGLGLTEQEIPQLFQRFYRSQRREIQSVPGNGMGLFLAKRLIALWGGQIGAEGALNQGSTFWFTLPIKRLNRQIT